MHKNKSTLRKYVRNQQTKPLLEKTSICVIGFMTLTKKLHNYQDMTVYIHKCYIFI